MNKRVLTDEELDETGFRLEQSPQKSLRRLAQQIGVSESSVQHATKLLKLNSYSSKSSYAPRQACVKAGGHHFQDL